MSIFRNMEISSSGLSVERMKMELISSNIANSSTTKTEDGEVYKRKTLTFKEKYETVINESGQKEKLGSGVKIEKIVEDDSDIRMIYDPSHPDSDENGFVTMPNVDVLDEIIDMMVATRAYEANVTAFNSSKSMLLKALEIGR
ncbi:flagellar basal body rod protein FlgC [Clostridium sediminicola]|uniref:flagellar basal body rod protein FlgC n=1 Tax=Clostridium sediminicola TaxID=3114879 RepID=UPI0031F27AC4